MNEREREKQQRETGSRVAREFMVVANLRLTVVADLPILAQMKDRGAQLRSKKGLGVYVLCWLQSHNRGKQNFRAF